MNEERMRQLEEAIEESIEVYNNCAAGSQDREKEARNLKSLIDALHEMYTAENDEEDKRERRRIEEEKNKTNAKIEEAKTKKDWKDKLHDILMLVIKGGIGLGAQVVLIKILLDFEENGTVRSKAAKDFKILNPFSWVR